MSRTVCSWCKAPLVLKDDILVCGNTDCPACDEKYLHEELIRTKKQLEMANAELDYIKEQIEKNSVFDNTRKALDRAKLILKNLLPDLNGYERLDVEKAINEITALEQKD